MELQRLAYNSQSSMTDLLRKSYVLSRKLNLIDFSRILQREMEGYKDEDELPAYRMIKGSPLMYGFPSKGFIEKGLYQPISELEYFLQHEMIKEKGRLTYTFLNGDKNGKVKLQQLSVQSSQVYNVIDRVRNLILEWTLELEDRGVLGDNMTFSEKEKQVANQISSVTNIIGTMVNSQLQQNSNNSPQTLFVEELKVESLKEILEQGNLLIKEITNADVKAELQADLATLETQLTSPKPKNNIIKESLSSVRNIAEGITGSLLATGIVEKIIPLLAKL